ncbi:PAS domain S-box protein [Glaciecola sp. 2405UD65-10]|uniref:PAS domain S-box protein n=1 Tax=Glaciecola sp. 2405UD65-10 TaxID=3397244 RepID=UPI003B5C6444
MKLPFSLNALGTYSNKLSPSASASIFSFLMAALMTIIIVILAINSSQKIHQTTQIILSDIAAAIEKNIKQNNTVLPSQIDALVPQYAKSDYVFIVKLANRQLYPSLLTSSLNEVTFQQNSWTKVYITQLHGVTWELSLTPKNQYLFASLYRTYIIFTVVALCFSSSVGIAAYTTLTAQRKIYELATNKRKTGLLMQHLPGMAYQAKNEKDWPMVYVSGGCEALSGWSRQAFESHEVLWGNLIHPSDLKRVVSVVDKAIAEQTFFELEYRIILPDSTVRHVWERGEAANPNATEETLIEGFITDISSIKQTEQALLTSHEFADAIVNSVVDAVITIDKDGAIQSFNNAAENMFGYQLKEVIQRNVSMLMPEHHAKMHNTFLDNFKQTQTKTIIGKGRELVGKRKDGSEFPIHLSVSEIQSQDEMMFVGLIRDNTEQRNALEKSKQHIEEMAHAVRLNLLSEMTAGIAQEINQPLTAISGLSEHGRVVGSKGEPNGLPGVLDKINQHALQAIEVLERMNAMSKHGVRSKEVVECGSLIKDVVYLAATEARQRDIIVKVQQHDSKAKIYVDSVQIQQVILNLLRNAMEAMQAVALEHGNSILLSCQCEEAKYVKISVIDSGCGLSKKAEGTLFTPFNSTKEQGMGVGLSISKSIIEEHGGSIHYLKTTLPGAEFYFYLPLANTAVEKVPV